MAILRPSAPAMAAALRTFLACARPEPAAEPEPAQPVDTAPPAFAVRIPYSLQGVPGPWWRDNAMHGDFEVDQRECRAVSTAARRTAASGDRKDAAYRAFLDCMTEREWTRGIPPPTVDE